MTRNLDITISLTEDNFGHVSVYETETGDHTSYEFPIEPDEHPEFNEWIGNEIYGWLLLMLDAKMDEHADKESACPYSHNGYCEICPDTNKCNGSAYEQNECAYRD